MISNYGSEDAVLYEARLLEHLAEFTIRSATMKLGAVWFLLLFRALVQNVWHIAILYQIY